MVNLPSFVFLDMQFMVNLPFICALLFYFYKFLFLKKIFITLCSRFVVPSAAKAAINISGIIINGIYKWLQQIIDHIPITRSLSQSWYSLKKKNCEKNAGYQTSLQSVNIFPKEQKYNSISSTLYTYMYINYCDTLIHNLSMSSLAQKFIIRDL